MPSPMLSLCCEQIYVQIEDIHVDCNMPCNLPLAEQPPSLKPLIQKKGI